MRRRASTLQPMPDEPPDPGPAGRPSRADAVRAAVDQAFQATAGSTQKRVQEIADDLASSVGRLRDVLDEARPVTGADLEALRADLAALSVRVEALERRS